MDLLLISFDIIDDDEPDIPYSIASIISYLKSINPSYEIRSYSIRLNPDKNLGPKYDKLLKRITDIALYIENERKDVFSESDNKIDLFNKLITCFIKNEENKRLYDIDPDLLKNIDLLSTDLNSIFKMLSNTYIANIAIGEYFWSESYSNFLLATLKFIGYDGQVILGGYQITSKSEQQLISEHPSVDYFIKGYGEEALAAILNGTAKQRILTFDNIDCSKLPSPYLDGTITLSQKTSKIRWETKRGCPFKCDYCEWSRLRNQISNISYDRLLQELKFFHENNVDKVNVLDPTFNSDEKCAFCDKKENCNHCQIGYMQLIEEFKKYPDILFSLQLHPTMISDKFLEICKGTSNISYEIGLQSLHPNLDKPEPKKLEKIIKIWYNIQTG